MHMVLTEGDLDSQQETSDQHPAQLHNVEEPEAVVASEQVGLRVLCLLWLGVAASHGSQVSTIPRWGDLKFCMLKVKIRIYRVCPTNVFAMLSFPAT